MCSTAYSTRTRRAFYPDVMAVKFDGVKHEVLIFEVKLRVERETIYIGWPEVLDAQGLRAEGGGRRTLW